jgi:hypothetical protein
MAFKNVSVISHADWSINPKKRWMAVAIKQPNHHWIVHQPTAVIDPTSLFTHLNAQLPHPGCILSGFDFPIGLPYHFALRAGISDFLTALPLLGHKEWSEFYIPAEIPSQINIHRPFYPNRPGGTKRQHLESGLDLTFDQLFRLCETAHENRRAACPLFWTLGGQQVGKAAINGWRSLITPSLFDPKLRLNIWPFSGSLEQLCQPGNIVVAETYPAEFYGHLGLFTSKVRMSKRRLADRCFYAKKLISWSEDHHLDLDDPLLSSIKDGFGDYINSEDRFDALVGLYGMINVVQGNHPSGEPVPYPISKIEGWILGQQPPIKDTYLAGIIE